jgi:hypothetical protein
MHPFGQLIVNSSPGLAFCFKVYNEVPQVASKASFPSIVGASLFSEQIIPLILANFKLEAST